MRGPIKISLERLAATYGIDNLGLAWIQTDVDSNRTLVLQPVPKRGMALLMGSEAEYRKFAAEEMKRQLGVPTPELLATYPDGDWLSEKVTG
ncbi:MAG TPA: hypothetical protein VIU40_00875 [Geobacteraceae bacterium]